MHRVTSATSVLSLDDPRRNREDAEVHASNYSPAAIIDGAT